MEKAFNSQVRKAAASVWFWIGACVVSLLVHFWWAYSTNDNMPLARCGATWAIFSSFVIARPVVRMGFERWYALEKKMDGGGLVPTAEEMEADRQDALDKKSTQTIGPAMLIVSTLQWAYGDLLGPFVRGCPWNLPTQAVIC